MEEAFGIVIFVVVAIAVIGAIVSLTQHSDLYDQIGRGGLALRDERDRPINEPAASSPAGQALAEEEIRQMLAASNARRERRGQPPLDVDEELARLTRPQIDGGLRAEITELVKARNQRRVRQGKEPLDVDAEVERQIADLT